MYVLFTRHLFNYTIVIYISCPLSRVVTIICLCSILLPLVLNFRFGRHEVWRMQQNGSCVMNLHMCFVGSLFYIVLYVLYCFICVFSIQNMCCKKSSSISHGVVECHLSVESKSSLAPQKDVEKKIALNTLPETNIFPMEWGDGRLVSYTYLAAERFGQTHRTPLQKNTYLPTWKWNLKTYPPWN